MKRLVIGAVMIGAMAGQLSAQWGYPSCGRRHGYNSFPYWGFACDPFYARNNGDGYPAPSVTVAIPQVVAALPARPPEPPIRPEVHEYNWPPSPSDFSAARFSIVFKDGRVQAAIAVWVQDDALCYITPDGSEGRVPIHSIDRQATRQRNAEKQLNIWLPD